MAVALSTRTPEAVDRLSSWRDDWGGLRVVVLGSGAAGFAAADTLVELGASVTVLSESIDDTTAEVLSVLDVRMLAATRVDGVPSELDELDPELVIVSPGFAPRHPFVSWATARPQPVWGDVELAWRLRDKVINETTGAPAEWVAVTGTNGKSTTVKLTEAMLLAAGVRALACGNSGVPVLDAIRAPDGFEVLVVELSSFQLHYAQSLSAHSSVCLNVADDHLGWHGSLEAYRSAKAKVYSNTRVACVYNRDDPTTRRLVEDADVVEGARAIGFGLGVPGPSDLGVVDGIACDRAFVDDRQNTAREIAAIDELAALGLGTPHAVSNALAATALARSVGIPMSAVVTGLRGFRDDRHRTELVVSAAGVTWVDDSKATNSHAARASLRSFDSVVWIAGGLLKGADPNALVAESVGRLRGVVLIGANRGVLRAAIARHAPELPVFEVEETETDGVMPSAVRFAAGMAVHGDTVLLAPAAAAMDQFRDYADRGRRFQTAVRDLVGVEADDDKPAAST